MKSIALSMALALSLTVVAIGERAVANDAGCGLGSVLISKNAKIQQLFAMTTNLSLFSQPLGITFGTSGCSASSLVMNEKAIEYFAETNQSDLTREMAQGQGEKLATLASLHGCTAQGQKDFAQVAQRSYGKILPAADTSAGAMIRNLQTELRADPNASHECTAVASR